MKTKKTLLSELKHYPIIPLFFGVLVAFMLGEWLGADNDTSELENRPLAQQPSFDAGFTSARPTEERGWLGSKYDAFAKAAASWTTGYNEYAKDQLPFRDGWISMHSVLESAQGKLENGGVWYAKDDYQITKNTALTDLQQRTIPVNAQAVGELSQRYPGQVTTMLIPSPANTLSPLLRYHPQQMDENAILNETFAQWESAGANVIDLRPVFAQNMDTQIYYYTDHHWTTTGGAWLGYQAYCEAAGRQAVLPDPGMLQSVPGFLGTNYAKTKKFNTKPDTLEYYDFPNPLTVYTLQGNDPPSEQTGPLMDAGKLDEYDKYAAFLRGNNGYSEIQGDGEGSVLLVKDSYGNSFAPYLIQNYAKVGIIDLRSWFALDETIQTEGYDEILVLYSFDNFSADPYLRRMLTDFQESLEN